MRREAAVSAALWSLAGRRAHDFVMLPSTELGAGWEAELFPQGLRIGALSARAHLFVSRFINGRLGFTPVAPCLDVDDKRIGWAIALLSRPRLERFICHMGCALAADEVRQAILRSEVQAYRSALGDELYGFVLHRVPLLASHSEAPTLRHGPSGIMQAVRATGTAAVKRILDASDNELWRRLEARLERQCTDAAEAPISTSTESLQRVARRVMREIETSWTSQFLNRAAPAC
ncbi:MAG: hypothetical protein JWR25_2071 [Noviherbaspirillum sp.]|nr:hypothetical protein [Noviherbaspirillum sp.]